MSDFVPSQSGQPPGMNLFAPDEPPAYLNIGKVKFVFGCGGSKYTFTHDSEPSLGGTTLLTITDTAWPCAPVDGEPINKESLDSLTRVWAIEFLEWFKIQFDRAQRLHRRDGNRLHAGYGLYQNPIRAVEWLPAHPGSRGPRLPESSSRKHVHRSCSTEDHGGVFHRADGPWR